MYTMLSTTKQSEHTIELVAIVDCTHVRVTYSFLQGLGNIAQENTISDTLEVDQLKPLYIAHGNSSLKARTQ